MIGEELAALWLTCNGRKVLRRNHQSPHGGEVDIVCREGRTLVFVEVKTRTYVDEIRRPRDAVTLDKQKLIQRGASSWLKMLPRFKATWRFDIIEVFLLRGELPRIVHVVDAFRQ